MGETLTVLIDYLQVNQQHFALHQVVVFVIGNVYHTFCSVLSVPPLLRAYHFPIITRRFSGAATRTFVRVSLIAHKFAYIFVFK